MNGIQENQKLKSVQNANQFIGINRKCPKCKETKDLSMFYCNKTKKLGRDYWCKKCSSLQHKIWMQKNPEQCRILANRSRVKNQKKINATLLKWGHNNPEKRKLWKIRNPEKAKEKQRKDNHKRMENPKHRLSHNISNSIRHHLHGKKCGTSWELLVGYTGDQLKIHLEKQFIDGMTWDNY